MLPTAVLPAQYAGTLDYFETSRVDARANEPLPRAPTPPPREIAIAGDASISPNARLRLTDRRWDWTLTYTPTFSVTDFELASAAQPVVLNAGAASVVWHARSARVWASESGSYGWENLAYLYGAPVAGQAPAAGQSQTPGQTAPGQATGQAPSGTSSQAVGQTGTAPTVPLQTFPFGSSSTSAGVQIRATRSLTFLVSGGYSLSGNLSGTSQAAAVYPEQFGPSASAAATYVTRSDSYTTTASAQQITTPQGICVIPRTDGSFCREVDPVASLSETARHRLSRTASLAASLGVSAAVYQVATGTTLGILPTGAVTFTDRFGPPPRDVLEQPVGVRLSADIAPTVNVFTGMPSNRFEVTGSLVQRVAPRVVLGVVAGVLQTVDIPRPDPSPLTVLNGGVDLRVRMTRLISVSMGVQAFWQSQANVGGLPVASAVAATGNTLTASEVGYVSLTVRAPRLRF